MHGKMAINTVANWLGFGIENPGGGHEGMNGAHVVFGIHEAPTEADSFGAPYMGSGVSQYTIHPYGSAFRNWNDTQSMGDLANTELVMENNCYTSMTFSTAIIQDWALNLTTGSLNNLIWGSGTSTYLKGYHGRQLRGHLKDLDLTMNIVNYTMSETEETEETPPASGSTELGNWAVGACALLSASWLLLAW